MSSQQTTQPRSEQTGGGTDGPRRPTELIRDAVQRLKRERGEGEAAEEDEISVVAALRHEYETQLDLYKHYLTVAASFTVLYYAVTGAVVAYALRGERWLALALSFPILMSFFFALVFSKAWEVFEQMEKDIKDVAAALGRRRDEVEILTRILQYAFYMYLFNCCGLLILLILKSVEVIPAEEVQRALPPR